MKSKVNSLIIIAFFCLISVTFSTLGANWVYPDMLLQFEESSNLNVALQEFEYTPDEVLPGGDNDEQLNVGENHMQLITNIVDHVTYGLNATSKPIIQELLNSGVKVVYSNQNVSGGNLKHILINDSSMEAIDFAIKYETSTFYTTYTFESKFLTDSYIDSTINVFKTDMVCEDGVWIAKRSYRGTAKVASILVKNKIIINIDVYSWSEGTTAL